MMVLRQVRDLTRVQKLANFGFAAIMAIVFLILVIAQLADFAKLQPFYSQITCTGPYHYIDVQHALDSATGVLEVKDKPTPIECNNPNEFDFKFESGSHADIFMLPETLGVAGETLINQGEFKLSEAILGSDSRSTSLSMPFSWKINAKYVEGFQNYLQNRMRQGDLRPRFPMFYTWNLKTSIQYSYLGANYGSEDILPEALYCGFQWAFETPDATNGTRGFPIPQGALFIDTMTVCNHEYKKTLQDVQMLPTKEGPKIEVDHNHYIMDLSPTATKQSDMKQAFYAHAGTGIFFAVILFLIFLMMATGCCCCLYVDDSKASLPPPPEKPEPPTPIVEYRESNIQAPPPPEPLALMPPAPEAPPAFDEV
jgi:hypothetical protein